MPEEPVVPPPPAYEPEVDRTQITENLGTLRAYPQVLSAARIEQYLTESTTAADYAFLLGTVFDATAFTEGYLQPLPGVQTYGLRDRGVEELMAALQESYPAFTFQEVGRYADAPLYEMVNADGQVVFHLSAIAGQGSSIFVLWDLDPRAGA